MNSTRQLQDRLKMIINNLCAKPVKCTILNELHHEIKSKAINFIPHFWSVVLHVTKSWLTPPFCLYPAKEAWKGILSFSLLLFELKKTKAVYSSTGIHIIYGFHWCSWLLGHFVNLQHRSTSQPTDLTIDIYLKVCDPNLAFSLDYLGDLTSWIFLTVVHM